MSLIRNKKNSWAKLYPDTEELCAQSIMYLKTYWGAPRSFKNFIRLMSAMKSSLKTNLDESSFWTVIVSIKTLLHLMTISLLYCDLLVSIFCFLLYGLWLFHGPSVLEITAFWVMIKMEGHTFSQHKFFCAVSTLVGRGRNIVIST